MSRCQEPFLVWACLWRWVERKTVPDTVSAPGIDQLSGGSGEDILVGGKTIYDNDVDAIRAILAEWTTNARGFQQRSDNIFGTGTGARLNGNYFLNASSVIDDGVTDTVSGGNGQDWFFAELSEISDFVSGGLTPDRRN